MNHGWNLSYSTTGSGWSGSGSSGITSTMSAPNTVIIKGTKGSSTYYWKVTISSSGLASASGASTTMPPISGSGSESGSSSGSTTTSVPKLTYRGDMMASYLYFQCIS